MILRWLFLSGRMWREILDSTLILEYRTVNNNNGIYRGEKYPMYDKARWDENNQHPQ